MAIDVFGREEEEQDLFGVDPGIAPIVRPSSVIQQTRDGVGGGGAPGTVVVQTAQPEQSSTSRKVQSRQTRAAVSQADQQLAEVQRLRAAATEAEGRLAQTIAEQERQRTADVLAAENAAAAGRAQAQSEFESARTRWVSESKAAQAEVEQAEREAGKAPFSGKNTLFHVVRAFLTAGNSYNSYVMGLDPSQSPFARSIRALADQDVEAKKRKYLGSKERADFIRAHGLEAAETEYANKVARFNDEAAAGIRIAAAKADSIKSSAEAGKTALVPVVGPDGQPIVGPDGKPQMEQVPLAELRKRVAAAEEAHRESEALVARQSTWDATRKVVDQPAAGPSKEEKVTVTFGGKDFTVRGETDARNLRSKTAAVERVSALVDQIQAKLRDSGQVLVGEMSGEIAGDISNLHLEIKDLYQAGALDEGMIKIADQITGNPTKIKSLIEGGKSGAITRLGNLKDRAREGLGSELVAQGNDPDVVKETLRQKSPTEQMTLPQLEALKVKLESGQASAAGLKGNTKRALEIVNAQIAKKKAQ